jgi:hypothetical protein
LLLAIFALLTTSVAGLLNAWVFVPRVREVWRRQRPYYRVMKVVLLPFYVAAVLWVWYEVVRSLVLAIEGRSC